MSLQNEIDKLKTLQESFNELSSKVLDTQAVLTELNNGKKEMVDALATKNVKSSTDKTLSAIASDIRSIAQSPITIDGGEMYEKQLFGAVTDKTNAYEQPDSLIWNLYQVMTNILSDGRFAGYGGIVLCEYDKSVTSQSFEGASVGGLYFTSEGKILDALGEYVWNDFDNGKANRWVAIMNKEEYVDVTFITVKNTPLSIHIGRKVGLLTTTQARTNIREIICTDGNEYGLKLAQTNMFGESLVFRGLSQINTDYIVPSSSLKNTRRIVLSINGDINVPSGMIEFSTNSAGFVKSVIFEKIGKVTGCLFRCTTASDSKSTPPFYVQFPPKYIFEGDCIMQHYTALDDGLKTLTIKNLYGLSMKSSIIYNSSMLSNVNIGEIVIPDLEIMGASAYIIKPFSQNYGGSYTALKRIYIPKLRQANVLFHVIGSSGVKNLIDVEVGAMETSFSVQYWIPSEVLADVDKTVQLNTNIRDHIAAKVTDRNGQEPLTITFHQLLRDALTEETEQAFRDKNWNIAPAKTVTE